MNKSTIVITNTSLSLKSSGVGLIPNRGGRIAGVRERKRATIQSMWPTPKTRLKFWQHTITFTHTPRQISALPRLRYGNFTFCPTPLSPLCLNASQQLPWPFPSIIPAT